MVSTFVYDFRYLITGYNSIQKWISYRLDPLSVDFTQIALKYLKIFEILL